MGATGLDTLIDRARAKGVDLERIPVHVAIIMDGNGRWAESRGEARIHGHHRGYRTLRDIVLIAGKLGVRYLTVYAFSAENWRRPEGEVRGLMELLALGARDELAIMHRNDVRFRVAGRVAELPDDVRAALERDVEATAANTGITLTLAVNYGGRAEIVDAARALLAEGADPATVDEDSFRSRLYNPDIPDPDLLIRTAGEMRWSNFLIWQAAYTELVVLDLPWPEFGESHLMAAIAEFQGRTRKFGGLTNGATRNSGDAAER